LIAIEYLYNIIGVEVAQHVGIAGATCFNITTGIDM
jgi:hypothetical protein